MKRKKILPTMVVLLCFVAHHHVDAVVKLAETREEFFTVIRDNVNEILQDAMDTGSYDYLLSEALPDIETEQELDIVAALIEARANELGTINKKKIDAVINKTRKEIRELAQPVRAEVEVENLGYALRSLSQKKR